MAYTDATAEILRQNAQRRAAGMYGLNDTQLQGSFAGIYDAQAKSDEAKRQSMIDAKLRKEALDVQKYGIDSSFSVGMAGVGATKRGQDLNYKSNNERLALDTTRAANDYEINKGNLDISGKRLNLDATTAGQNYEINRGKLALDTTKSDREYNKDTKEWEYKVGRDPILDARADRALDIQEYSAKRGVPSTGAQIVSGTLGVMSGISKIPGAWGAIGQFLGLAPGETLTQEEAEEIAVAFEDGDLPMPPGMTIDEAGQVSFDDSFSFSSDDSLNPFGEDFNFEDYSSDFGSDDVIDYEIPDDVLDAGISDNTESDAWDYFV